MDINNITVLIEAIFAVVATIVAIMSAIAAVFPKPSKNKYWIRVHKLINLLAINILHAKNSSDDIDDEVDNTK